MRLRSIRFNASIDNNTKIPQKKPMCHACLAHLRPNTEKKNLLCYAKVTKRGRDRLVMCNRMFESLTSIEILANRRDFIGE